MTLFDYWAGLPRKGWEAHAACRGLDRARFFTNDHRVKQVCARCPVSDDCLAFILRVESEEFRCRHGVFGGMTPKERHRFAELLRKARVSLHWKAA